MSTLNKGEINKWIRIIWVSCYQLWRNVQKFCWCIQVFYCLGLVSSLFRIATHLLKSAFIIPSFQILFEDIHSSTFGSNMKFFRVLLDRLSDTQQSINFVSSSTNCLLALFEREGVRNFSSRKICSRSLVSILLGWRFANFNCVILGSSSYYVVRLWNFI